MNKEDINELLEYNNEYMEAQISEEIFGGDHTSAVELEYVKKENQRLQQELERYKNIIDELETYLKTEKWKCISDIRLGIINEFLNKLKELKGSDS